MSSYVKKDKCKYCLFCSSGVALVCHPLIINVQGNPGQHPNVASLYTDDLDDNFNPATGVCLEYQTDDVYLMKKVHAWIWLLNLRIIKEYMWVLFGTAYAWVHAGIHDMCKYGDNFVEKYL